MRFSMKGAGTRFGVGRAGRGRSRLGVPGSAKDTPRAPRRHEAGRNKASGVKEAVGFLTHHRYLTSDKKETVMSIAKISEISAISTKSFEDATVNGIARANKTLRNVRSA